MKKGGRHSAGFTIVETIIVLAVSSGLAVSALIFLNGRQNKTEFQVAINNLQQLMQQNINEISSGYYASDGKFTCDTAGSIKPHIELLSVGSKQSGTNGGCIFMGKAFLFGSNFSGHNTISQYTLVGRRTTVAGSDVGKPSQAQVVALATTPGTANRDAPSNLVESDRLENGLDYRWVRYPGSSITKEQTVFTIISSLSDNSGDKLNSGGQAFSLHNFAGVSDWNLEDSQNKIAVKIYNNELADDPKMLEI